jgi:hypothetical protein
MKNIFIFCLFVMSFLNITIAQTPTFSEHIAPLLYSNCATCHRPGGIGHFSLQSYSDAVLWSSGIKNAITQRIMPPWPPDAGYGDFCHERNLSEADIQAITDWIDNGMPEGNTNLKPPVPNFPTGRIISETPDMVIKMPVYASQANVFDEYKCFTIPTGLTQDKYIKAIEVVPGNLSIVHHVIAVADESGIGNCNQAISTGKTLVGYAPGSMPSVFPNNDDIRLGILLKAGSNILLQMHYPKGSAGQVDSTVVNFYFYPDNTSDIREVVPGPYLVNLLINIPANTTKNYSAYFPYNGTTTEDLSLVAVFPHMHKIGRNMRSFAVTSANDTIQLFKISNWRFDWQGYYNYKQLVKIPAGSRIYGEAFYDNTVNNPYNPSNPPQDVTLGEQTNDEMFLISFQSVPYEAGDELFDIESMLNFTSAQNKPSVQQIPVAVFPNPSSGQLEITGWQQAQNELTHVVVTDMLGRIVFNEKINADNSSMKLNIENTLNGMYFISLQSGANSAFQKIALTGK